MKYNKIDITPFLSSYPKLFSILPACLLLFSFSLITFLENSQAQNSTGILLQPRGNITTSGEEPIPDITSVDRPVLEQISENGNYMVQLRYNNVPTLGFDLSVYFLNPDIQEGTEATVDEAWSNLSGQGPETFGKYVDPSVIMYLKPASNYDITVYDDSGNILWQADNQPVYAGRGYQQVSLKGYSGPVAVAITDIRQESPFSPVEITTPDSATFRFEVN